MLDLARDDAHVWIVIGPRGNVWLAPRHVARHRDMLYACVAAVSSPLIALEGVRIVDDRGNVSPACAEWVRDLLEEVHGDSAAEGGDDTASEEGGEDATPPPCPPVDFSISAAWLRDAGGVAICAMHRDDVPADTAPDGWVSADGSRVISAFAFTAEDVDPAVYPTPVKFARALAF